MRDVEPFSPVRLQCLMRAGDAPGEIINNKTNLSRRCGINYQCIVSLSRINALVVQLAPVKTWWFLIDCFFLFNVICFLLKRLLL